MCTSINIIFSFFNTYVQFNIYDHWGFVINQLKKFIQKCTQSKLIREAAKTSSSHNGRAIRRGPLKRVNGRAIKEKRTFFETFFFLLPFENKNYFTLDNLSKYGHITLKFIGRYFYLVVTIFSKK